jgi:hypothetical protein
MRHKYIFNLAISFFDRHFMRAIFAGQTYIPNQGARMRGLHFCLFRPAFLFGGQAQIAVGDQMNALGFESQVFSRFQTEESLAR